MLALHHIRFWANAWTKFVSILDFDFESTALAAVPRDLITECPLLLGNSSSWHSRLEEPAIVR